MAPRRRVRAGRAGRTARPRFAGDDRAAVRTEQHRGHRREDGCAVSDMLARLERLEKEHAHLVSLTRQMAQVMAGLAEAGHEMAQVVDELKNGGVTANNL